MEDFDKKDDVFFVAMMAAVIRAGREPDHSPKDLVRQARAILKEAERSAAPRRRPPAKSWTRSSTVRSGR